MKDKYTLEQVADVIDNEGLGYAVQSYMSGDHIEDPELADLWDKAGDALNAIENYIADKLEEADDDPDNL